MLSMYGGQGLGSNGGGISPNVDMSQLLLALRQNGMGGASPMGGGSGATPMANYIGPPAGAMAGRMAMPGVNNPLVLGAPGTPPGQPPAPAKPAGPDQSTQGLLQMMQKMMAGGGQTGLSAGEQSLMNSAAATSMGGPGATPASMGFMDGMAPAAGGAGSAATGAGAGAAGAAGGAAGAGGSGGLLGWLMNLFQTAGPAAAALAA